MNRHQAHIPSALALVLDGGDDGHVVVAPVEGGGQVGEHVGEGDGLQYRADEQHA